VTGRATRCIRTDCRVGALAVTVSNLMRGYITMTVDLLAMMQVYSCHGGCYNCQLVARCMGRTDSEGDYAYV
jgi:hypothetical protein